MFPIVAPHNEEFAQYAAANGQKKLSQRKTYS
jgi:hypothetical protein